jgi:putative ABC transport system ATP-binding protein
VLDSKTSTEVMDLLTEVNRSGKTVVIITHENNITKQTNHIIQLKNNIIKPKHVLS